MRIEVMLCLLVFSKTRPLQMNCSASPPVCHLEAAESRLSAFPKDTSKLPAFSPRHPFRTKHQAQKLKIPFLSLFVRLDHKIEPRSTNCEADALNTTPQSYFLTDQTDNKQRVWETASNLTAFN